MENFINNIIQQVIVENIQKKLKVVKNVENLNFREVEIPKRVKNLDVEFPSL